MPDDPTTHTQTILTALLEEIRGIRPQSCGAPAEVVKEHTKILTTLEINMGHMVESLSRIEKKLDDGNETFKDHNDRIVKMETQKGTAIAMIMAVGGALWSGLTWYINMKAGK